MTQDKKDLTKLVVFAIIGVVGLVLIVGYLFGEPTDVEAQAAGGLDAIATPVGCDLVQLQGTQFAVCEDGSQWVLEEISSSDPLAASLEGEK